MLKSALLDRAAMSGSIVCLLHCLALPLVLAIAPALSWPGAHSELFHVTMLVLVVPVSLTALLRGFLAHRDTSVLVIGSIGLVALALAVLWAGPQWGENAERMTTILGSVVLAVAHLRNLRQSRSCSLHEEAARPAP